MIASSSSSARISRRERKLGRPGFGLTTGDATGRMYRGDVLALKTPSRSPDVDRGRRDGVSPVAREGGAGRSSEMEPVLGGAVGCGIYVPKDRARADESSR
jgi:hypothetical protein